MLELNFRKVAQAGGDYDVPSIEEKRMKNRVVGKICFDDRSNFCEAAGDQFMSKVSEIVQKRFPKAEVSGGEILNGDKRCCTYVATSIDESDVEKVASIKTLEKQGFKDLGGGTYKKSNELWSLKVDDKGDYNIVRSESESLFGTDTEEKEVIVSRRIEDGEVEVLNNKEVKEKGYFIDEDYGTIFNSTKDHVGQLLFIIEAEKKTAVWWEGRKFKHPETENMVQFTSLPIEEQKKLNEQVKKQQPEEKTKGPKKEEPKKPTATTMTELKNEKTYGNANQGNLMTPELKKQWLKYMGGSSSAHAESSQGSWAAFLDYLEAPKKGGQRITMAEVKKR